MIVAIDGPAGAGKSTLSRELARRLGFRFLDTGAMYRVVALAGLRRRVDWSDSDVLEKLAQQTTISFSADRTHLNDEDVTDEIRSPEVTAAIHYVADDPQVRRHLVEQQQRIGAGGNIVTEGRDQGTVAFPHAACKIYLTASPEERARRRVEDLRSRGQSVAFEVVLAEQNERDRRDQGRSVGRLVKADDAVELCTDGMSPEQVVRRMEEIVQDAKRKHTSPID